MCERPEKSPLQKRLDPLRTQDLGEMRSGTGDQGTEAYAVEAVAFLLLQDDRVLMECCPRKAVRHGCEWFIPSGRIDVADPSPEHALVRELREELGLQAREFHRLPLVDASWRGRPEPFLMRPFLVLSWEGSVPSHCLDHPEVPLRWVPLEEARRSQGVANRVMIAQLPHWMD